MQPTRSGTPAANSQVAAFQRRWRWPLAAGAVVLMGGVGAALVLAAESDSPSDPAGELTVRGSLTLNDPDAGFGVYEHRCAGSGGNNDIRPGAQVTVTAADGTVLAIGELGEGTATGLPGDGAQPDSYARCRFTFEVVGVPTGHGLYGIEVANRGMVTFPEEQLRSVIDGPALTLG